MLDSLRYLASGDWRYLPWNVPIPQDEVSGELALALHRQEFNALAERIGEIIDSDPRRAMRMLWEFGERIGEEP